MLFGCRESVVDGNIHISSHSGTNNLQLVVWFQCCFLFLNSCIKNLFLGPCGWFNFSTDKNSYKESLLWVSFLEVPPVWWQKRKPRRAPTICDILKHTGMGPMNMCRNTHLISGYSNAATHTCVGRNPAPPKLGNPGF